MALQLFQLKTIIDESDKVWDTVTCANTQQDYFLCGPSSPSFETYQTIVSDFGRLVVENGRMETNSYILPFAGEQVLEGRPIGSFVKIYVGNLSRAKKEYESMSYLGRQPITFFNTITSNNFPAPRLLFDRILILPLILSRVELERMCDEKTEFYKTDFNITIDLSFVRPSPKSLIPAMNNRLKLVESFKMMALHLFMRRQLDVYRYIHGDAVPSNILSEDVRNLAHRLTGQWPAADTLTGLNFKDLSDHSLLMVSDSLPTLIDYDTVSFPSANHFKNLEDMFVKHPIFLKHIIIMI